MRPPIWEYNCASPSLYRAMLVVIQKKIDQPREENRPIKCVPVKDSCIFSKILVRECILPDYSLTLYSSPNLQDSPTSTLVCQNFTLAITHSSTRPSTFIGFSFSIFRVLSDYVGHACISRYLTGVTKCNVLSMILACYTNEPVYCRPFWSTNKHTQDRKSVFTGQQVNSNCRFRPGTH